MSKLFVSPHNDDEVLFGCFTLLREKPLVVVVFDSYVQPARGIPGADAVSRRKESQRACKILGIEVKFLGLPDLGSVYLGTVRAHIQAFADVSDGMYAPAFEQDGHPQHNLVAQACDGLPVVERYLTYTTRGKSTSERKVPYEPAWVALKLRALACYESQFHPAT